MSQTPPAEGDESSRAFGERYAAGFNPSGGPPPLEPVAPIYHRRPPDFRDVLYGLTPQSYVTTALIAVNVLIFVSMVARGVSLRTPSETDLLTWGGDLGYLTRHGQWWRLFTAMFLHIGPVHIGMNMLVLAMSGPFVERLLGNVGFLITYIFAGLAGSLASIAWNPTVLSAGASGAIFGVYGAMMGFVVLRHDSIPRQAIRSLMSSALLFVGYNVLFGMGANSHIDMAAHIGGLCGGFLCGLIQSQPLTLETGREMRRMRDLLTFILMGGLLIGTAAAMPVRLTDEARWALDLTVRSEVIKKEISDLRMRNEQLGLLEEKRIVPLWDLQKRSMERLSQKPRFSGGHEGEEMAVLLKYSSLRYEQWSKEAEGLRRHSAALLGEAREAGQFADDLADDLAAMAPQPVTGQHR